MSSCNFNTITCKIIKIMLWLFWISGVKRKFQDNNITSAQNVIK